MAYKLQVVADDKNLNFNVRYENLARADKPDIVAKNMNGDVVKQTTIYNGQPLPKGSTQRVWQDDTGNQYSKAELKFWLGDEEVSEIEQTKVFSIDGYQDLKNYLDTYIIATYYEIFPDNNGMKKDIDRERAVAANLNGMYQLWDYLNKNQVVARGEFCTSSRGFIASDGYIRAIDMNGKWGLEIGVFKEGKEFQHLNDGVPQAAPAIQATPSTGRKLKRI